MYLAKTAEKQLALLQSVQQAFEHDCLFKNKVKKEHFEQFES